MVGRRLVTLAVSMVRDAAGRDATLRAWLPFTAVQEQAWVPGRGVGVEVLYEHGKLAWHFAHERLHEWPLTGGASTLRRASAPNDELLRMSCRLLDALHWHGVAMVEWRCDDKGSPHLMEINARPWGSLPLTIAAGVDIPRGMLAMARGEPLPAAPTWRVGATARNITADVQWMVANARADHADPLLLTQPVVSTVIEAVRGLGWRETWDGWKWTDPAVAWTEVTRLARRPFAWLLRNATRRHGLWRAKRRHKKLIDRMPAGASRPLPSVLFVCLGNICRSPFAAAIALQKLEPIRVSSAGLHPVEGRPSPVHVVEAAKSFGVDLSQWTSRTLQAGELAGADLIVAMDLSNIDALAKGFPEAHEKATLLGLFNPDGPAEMADPYDLAPETTHVVLSHMFRAIEAMAENLPAVMAVL